MSNPRATVAIPSHGGNGRIGGLLQSLEEQDVDSSEFDVLVIDNASPEPLEGVAMRYSSSLALRVVVEKSLGEAHARNRGLAEVSSPIVIFLDDDVIAARNLVRTYLEAFRDPELSAAGGPIRARLPRSRPFWFRGSILALFALQDLGGLSDYGARYPFAANFALRTSDVRHSFDTRLGRRGKSLLSGAETRFFEQNDFSRIAHLPDASVQHVIPDERLRLAWVARRAFAQVRTRAMLRLTD